MIIKIFFNPKMHEHTKELYTNFLQNNDNSVECKFISILKSKIYDSSDINFNAYSISKESYIKYIEHIMRFIRIQLEGCKIEEYKHKLAAIKQYLENLINLCKEHLQYPRFHSKTLKDIQDKILVFAINTLKPMKQPIRIETLMEPEALCV